MTMKRNKRKRNADVGTERNKEIAMEGCCNNEVDRISELSDDILISIISRLTFPKATATSVLSSRWRRLYTHITSLNFYFPFKPPRSYSVQYSGLLWQQYGREVPCFVRKINQMLDSSKDNQSVTEFTVQLPCFRTESHAAEYWLDFAFSRRIPVVNINLLCRKFIAPPKGHCCWHHPFPLATLVNNTELLLGLKCLKELSLSAFEVKDSDVEIILSKAVVLERLSIDSSKKLQNVRVVGHNVLKHLDISHSPCIRSVEIRNMTNLVSLRCYELPVTYHLLLDYVPKLIELSTSYPSKRKLAKNLPKNLSFILDQLQVLKLSTNFLKSDDPKYELPKFTNLKHLELETRMNDRYRNDIRHDIHQLISIIEACPSLVKLEMKFLWMIRARFDRSPLEANHRRQAPNYTLKKVKLVGYYGSTSELEFAMYVVNNAVALEQLTVHVCDETSDLCRNATNHARRDLRSITPKSVRLSIH